MFAKIFFPWYFRFSSRKLGLKHSVSYFFMVCKSTEINFNWFILFNRYISNRHLATTGIVVSMYSALKCVVLWLVFFPCLFNWQTAGSGNQRVNFLRAKLFLCPPFCCELYEIMLPVCLSPSHFWHLTDFSGWLAVTTLLRRSCLWQLQLVV